MLEDRVLLVTAYRRTNLTLRQLAPLFGVSKSARLLRMRASGGTGTAGRLEGPNRAGSVSLAHLATAGRCVASRARWASRRSSRLGGFASSVPGRGGEPAAVLEFGGDFVLPRIDPAAFQFVEPSVPL